MEVVYMGLLSKVFNWVFKAILSPVFKFISGLLETVLGWLFRTVLQPLLINVLQPLLKSLVDLVMEILSGVIYSVYASCLGIVDSLQEGFHIFSGISEVTYKGRSYTLLELIFRMDSIQTAMYTVLGVSLALMFLFAILGVVRSMGDLDGEMGRPVSKVLSSTFRAMYKMFLIPVVCLFAIMMSNQIMVAINSALQGKDTSMARMVFVVSSLDACKKSEYNVSSGATDIGINDPVRKDYYEKNNQGVYKKDYADKDQVKKDFNLGKFDYMIGFLGTGFLIIVLGICMVTFITRIFDVVVLFIVSPFFAAVMPLDDGEKFKGWQEMFVAKLFGGYGSVMAMEVYMMICPAVMGGDIKFGDGSAEANYLIRLIFLLGGAWAVVKIGPVITQLLSYQAGMAESDTAWRMTAAAATVGRGAFSAAKGVSQATSQAYKGWRGRKDRALSDSDERMEKRLGFGDRNQTGGGTSRAASGAYRGGIAAERNASVEGVERGQGQARRTATMFGGRVTVNQSKGGHTYLGVDGKRTKFGRGADGKFNARLMGIGYRVGRDGKMDKVSLPFMRLKKDDAGKWRVSKIKTPIVSAKRMETVKKNPDGSESRTMGSLYCSDWKLTGYKARFDQDTGKVELRSRLGYHYQKNAEGKYVMTHRNHIGGGRTEFERQEDGSYRAVSRVGNFTQKEYSYDADGSRHTQSTVSLKTIERERKEGEQPRSSSLDKKKEHYIFRRDVVHGGDGQ